MRTFFDRELDTVATFWRIFRRDGVVLAFTSHDCDLRFAGINHLAAPGMVPSAIRLTSDLTEDSAEAQGALSHETISEKELSAGLFDEASIELGVVAWETLEHRTLYSGQIGSIEHDGNGFAARLRSAKRILGFDRVPRTSPSCRAAFCGPGCGLSARNHTSSDTLTGFDLDHNRIQLGSTAGDAFVDGEVRFRAGPQTGLVFGVIGAVDNWLILDRTLAEGTPVGTKVEVREGCDRTLATCQSRFDNAINFRGEPYLPGNDLLSRHGSGSG